MDERQRQAKYNRFFWPLALTGSIGLMGALLKNYFLLEFPDGVRELAIFALAWSVFMPLQSAMWMVPQAINVLVIDKASLRQSCKFFSGVVVVMTVPLLFVGFTDWGFRFLGAVYDIDAIGLETIQLYLKCFAPFPLIMTVGHFLHGMMVRVEATGRTTAIEVARILVMALGLWVGLEQGLSPVMTLIASQILAELLAIVLRLICLHPHRKIWQVTCERIPTMREIASFFVPLAFTTLMFSFGRPIVFGFVTKIEPENLPSGITLVMMIAGLNMAWSFIPLLVNPINQLRSVYVNYAREDLAGVTKLLRRTIVIIVSIWVVVGWSGLAGLFFQKMQGADVATSGVGVTAFKVLIVLPIFMGWRNYYHGLSLTYKQTRSMGLAALFRGGAIYLSCWMFYRYGLLDPATAAMAFGMGFIVETFVSMWATRSMRRKLSENRL